MPFLLVLFGYPNFELVIASFYRNLIKLDASRDTGNIFINSKNEAAGPKTCCSVILLYAVAISPVPTTSVAFSGQTPKGFSLVFEAEWKQQ